MTDLSQFENRKKRILIVEDDQDVAGLMRVILRKNGYDVAVSENGKAGLALSSRHRPDAILLDLNMPEMGGFDFLKHRHDFPDLGTIPVIVLTASRRPRDIERAIGLGAVDYVTKPVEYEALMLCLEKHVPSPYYTPPRPAVITWN